MSTIIQLSLFIGTLSLIVGLFGYSKWKNWKHQHHAKEMIDDYTTKTGTDVALNAMNQKELLEVHHSKLSTDKEKEYAKKELLNYHRIDPELLNPKNKDHEK